MHVDVATDLMIKAFQTDNYGTFLDYSYAILSADPRYTDKDIKTLQKRIAKVRTSRDDLSVELQRTHVADSRKHPVDQPMLDMDYMPDFGSDGP